MTDDTGSRGRHQLPDEGWRDRLGSLVRGDRQTLAPGALRGLVALLLAGLVLGLVYLWLARPVAEPAPRLERTVPPVAVGTPGAIQISSPAAAPLVVDVVGAVRRPGVVELPGGSRVRDAVEAAGGPTGRAQLASVNLARLLVDGEQLVVLRRGRGPRGVVAGSPAAGSVAGAAAPSGPTAPLDLNSATPDQLDTLPGIGPVLAQRIIEWRSQHGRFGSVDELTEVSGIGGATLDDLRDLVRV